MSLKFFIFSIVVLSALVIVLSILVNVIAQFNLNSNLFPGLNLRDLGMRYKVKPSMLCLTRPDLFTPKGKIYQRWYVISTYSFVAALLAFLLALYFWVQLSDSHPNPAISIQRSTDTFILTKPKQKDL
jgi:hypothetical protein